MQKDIPSLFARLERPRVLILALSGIGNLLMASPLFRALQNANPTAEIDLVVSSRGTKGVIEANPRIRQVFVGSAKPSFSAFRKLVATVRQERPTIGIVTHPGQLITSAGLLFFSRIPRRIGHRYSWMMLRNSSFLLTDPVSLLPLPPLEHALSTRIAHDVVQNLQLLEPLGITPDPFAARYEFPLTTDDRARADAWLMKHTLGNRTLIGMHPGSHGDLAYKRWPAERFAALGDQLAASHNASFLVCGGTEEQTLKTEVSARMRARSVVVDTPLRVTAALIARCAFFVSNDSGLMHIAASQNIPTFGLFGPTDERRTAPWGPHGHVIRAAGTQPTYEVSRLQRLRGQRGTDPSLLALSVDAVIKHISVREVSRS